MANAYYERGSSFNPDELADGDAIEAEFDAVVRGFDTIETQIDTNKAGYPTQTFHVAPATEATHAPQKAQLDAHVNDQSAVHGATSVNSPGRLMVRDINGDVAARTFVGVATEAKRVSYTTPNGGSATLVSGEMAGDDSFRLLIGGTDDGGWAEIATADNGNEPIFVRQYTGVFQSIARSLCLLDANGNTVIPGDLYLLGGYLLLEYGSNAAGEYYRFANGVQICTRAIGASEQFPVQHGYAAGFVSNPIIAISNDSAAAAYSSTINITTGYFSFVSNTTYYTVRIIAIGRWRW